MCKSLCYCEGQTNNAMCCFFQDCLRSCQEQIEQTLAVNLSTMSSSDSDNVESGVPTSKLDHAGSLPHPPSHEHLKEQPTTPTDVQDIIFH